MNVQVGRLAGKLCAALLLSVLAATAGRAEQIPSDAAGLPITSVASGPIVSIGGAVTEVVFALGAGDRVIAVDSTSRYPEAVGDLPNVGYMRQLSAEPILALTPALVLAVEGSGPAAALAQLREAGVPVVLVPDTPSVAGVFDKIETVATALGIVERGEELAAETSAAMAGVEEAAQAAARPRVLFLLSIGQGPPLAAGRDTSAEGIIALSGGINAVEGFEGFKPLSPEAAIAAAPDVLLITNRSLGLLGGEDGLLLMPEIAATPAGKARRIVVMDGLLLLGFGPRTPEAVRELAEHLHPAADGGAPAGDG